MNTAIGLIETKGLIGLVEATDAMAKAANVKILKRVSIGGAEPYPRRIHEAEAALDGAAPDAAAFAAAADAAAAAVDPMEDAMTDAAYRRDIVRATTRRGLEQALQ